MIFRQSQGPTRCLTVLSAVLAAFCLCHLLLGCAVLGGTVEEKTLVGLQSEVVVVRDGRGIPHIASETTADVFYALGYIQAADRLWQMEILRRAATGTLAEAFGQDYLQADLLARTMGFHIVAEVETASLSGDAERILHSFCRGINAYIEEGRLPLEYRLAGLKPSPWRAQDTLAILKYWGWHMSDNFRDELFYNDLLEEVDLSAALELQPYYPPDGITIIPKQELLEDNDEHGVNRGEEALEDLATSGGQTWWTTGDSLDAPGSGALGARSPSRSGQRWNPAYKSTVWAVSGNKTSSGRALLAAELSSPLNLPAGFYEAVLHILNEEGETRLLLAGALLPGTPLPLAGTNGEIAWAPSNSLIDTEDTFIHSRFGVEGDRRDERISVRGGRHQIIEIIDTKLGPVWPEELAGAEASYSVSWTGLQPGRALDALWRIAQASSWQGFKEGLELWTVPALNFIYADSDGNVGLKTAGLVPLRELGAGLLPVQAYRVEQGWNGFIPFSLLPEVLNPPEGYLVAANNRLVGPWYPYHLSQGWAEPYRAMRVVQHLRQESESITLKGQLDTLVDIRNLQAEGFVELVRPLLASWSPTPVQTQTRDILAGWGEEALMTPGSPAPLIYHQFYDALHAATFGRVLPLNLYDRFLETGSARAVFERLLGRSGSSWFDGIKRDANGSIDDLVEDDAVPQGDGDEPSAGQNRRAALAEAVFIDVIEEMMSSYGDDPADWRWSAHYRLTPEPHLGVPEGVIYSTIYGRAVEPSSVGGNATILSTLGWRFAIEVSAGETRAFSSLAGGNSGTVLSAQTRDQWGRWMSGETMPLELDWNRIKPSAHRRGVVVLILKPANR